MKHQTILRSLPQFCCVTLDFTLLLGCGGTPPVPAVETDSFLHPNDTASCKVFGETFCLPEVVGL